MPPATLRSLYAADEWQRFEAGVRRWLGENACDASTDGRLLSLDEALIVPSAYTYAVAVKAWMDKLGMSDLAGRIAPSDYSDAETFTGAEADEPSLQHRFRGEEL